jgi:hypothetical protein
MLLNAPVAEHQLKDSDVDDAVRQQLQCLACRLNRRLTAAVSAVG